MQLVGVNLELVEEGGETGVERIDPGLPSLCLDACWRAAVRLAGQSFGVPVAEWGFAMRGHGLQ